MGEKFSDWVCDDAQIEAFNEHGTCPCSDEDLVIEQAGRFSNYQFCRICGRRFVYDGNIEKAVHPSHFLETEKDGLVPAAEAWYPFKLLLDADDELSDFVEFWPDPSDNAWLWAHDGYFIGCLLYKFGHVRCLLIADGFRREGHGTEFMETWFEHVDLEEPVGGSYRDELEPFCDQLSFKRTR